MRRSSGTVVFFTLPLIFSIACVESHDADTASATASAANSVSAKQASVAQTLACKTDPVNVYDGLHLSLSCAGLFSDIDKKKVADGVEPYAPGLVLWSDGADKKRWFSLPAGKQIDATNPGDWVFPNGTRFFKEFSVGGRRVETRLFEKQKDEWSRATYAWNDDETEATRSEGGDIMVDGNAYHLPTEKECDQCHQGRNDRALGFEQIALGVQGATGLTLPMLVKKKLITPAPAVTAMAISTDAGDVEAQIIGWTHMNCGVSCHNSNPNASSHQTKLRMRLEPEQLDDGSKASEYEFLKTTVGVAATTPRWGGKIRIVPGKPEDSLLYQLISVRGGGENDQMPPIASRAVDEPYVKLIGDWIRAMPAAK